MLLGALVFAIVCAALGLETPRLLGRASNDFVAQGSESLRAEALVERASGLSASPQLLVLVRDPTASRLARVARIVGSEPLFPTRASTLYSRDRRAALVARRPALPTARCAALQPRPPSGARRRLRTGRRLRGALEELRRPSRGAAQGRAGNRGGRRSDRDVASQSPGAAGSDARGRARLSDPLRAGADRLRQRRRRLAAARLRRADDPGGAAPPARARPGDADLDVRAQHRHWCRPRPGDRLQPAPRLPLSRGACAAGTGC